MVTIVRIFIIKLLNLRRASMYDPNPYPDPDEIDTILIEGGDVD